MIGMNWIDLIVILVILVLFAAALIYSRKHPSQCDSNCAGCGKSCSSRKEGDVPDFVKAYRKDHPKQQNGE